MCSRVLRHQLNLLLNQAIPSILDLRFYFTETEYSTEEPGKLNKNLKSNIMQ